MHRRGLHRIAVLWVQALFAAVSTGSLAQSNYAATIERVKPSIVAVGSFERTRSPQFQFLGTGFAVDNGLLVVTNHHVIPKSLNSERKETLAVASRSAEGSVLVRAARPVKVDAAVDLALLQIDGPALPPLQIGDSGSVREGDVLLFTGFPIGAVLGLFPVTHRTMIAAVTPIAIPAGHATKLDGRSIRRLAAGAYPVFQLDGTAYPGNSGSPVYDPQSGAVIGIVNSVLVKQTKEAALSHPSGISYAIPAQKLKDLLAR